MLGSHPFIIPATGESTAARHQHDETAVNPIAQRSQDALLNETSPPALSQYATKQLIGQVRALVVGPQAWKGAIYSDLLNEQPLVAEEIIVPLVGPCRTGTLSGPSPSK
jgi:hypothetical protein